MAPQIETTPQGSAGDRWRRDLAAWSIPDSIRAQAVTFPYEMDPALFRPSTAGTDSDSGAGPSLATQRALEAFDETSVGDEAIGTVIDVGCGGGAATMAVAERLRGAVGVDHSPAMLEVFAEEAQARGLDVATVVGTWPEVADAAGRADLVLCHHVAYNVADLAPFALALATAASRRVVMELTLTHPQTANAPLWQEFWDLDRPEGPSAEDALAVITETGIDATLEIGYAGSLRREASVEARAVTATRMLCLGPERLAEVEAAVRELPPRSDQRAVIWWDPS